MRLLLRKKRLFITRNKRNPAQLNNNANDTLGQRCHQRTASAAQARQTTSYTN